MIITTMNRHAVAIPLATMTNAQRQEGGDWIVTDARGEEHHVNKIAYEMAVECTPASMVPAQPGTYLIDPCDDADGKPGVWKHTILAWMVCADTEVRPVTLDPEALLSPPWQVLHPDGRVERSDGQAWETLDDWLAEVRKVREAA